MLMIQPLERILLSSTVVIGHGPCHGEETEQKGESFTPPARAVRNVRKHPRRALLVWSEDEQRILT